MKVIMDADCLIKLTKAGLKEWICSAFTITIPGLVKKEVVDRGKEKDLSDAFVIEKNLRNGLIKVKDEKDIKSTAGEKDAVALFQKGGFDAIGSDDKRFIRQLELFDIPYMTPATFIAVMVKTGSITKPEALRKLDLLSAYVSESEYYAVKLFIEQMRAK